jgi:hypothetical protein
VNPIAGNNMNEKSDWYKDIALRIEDIKFHLKPRDEMWLKLDALSSAAERIAQLSSKCAQCLSFRDDLDRLTVNARNLVEKDEKVLWASYLSDLDETMEAVTGHLQKKHRLVYDAYYMITCATIGGGIGLITGSLVFDSDVIGLAVGVGAGVAIGAALDTWARRRDKIISEKPPRFSGTYWGWLLMWLGILIAIAAFLLFKLGIHIP